MAEQEEVIQPARPKNIVIKTSPSRFDSPPRIRDSLPKNDFEDKPSFRDDKARNEEFERIKKEDQPKRKPLKPIPKNGSLLNYESMSEDEVEEYRALFKVRYSQMASENEKMNIVYPGDHIAMDIIHTTYFNYVKIIIAEIQAEEYKLYLVVILMALEFFGTQYMHLPISGFTEYQLNNFNRYRKYLLEMGEEYSLDGGSSHPAWMRMMFFGVCQLVLFIGIKFLSSKMGGGEKIFLDLQTKGTDYVMDKTSNGITDDENIPLPKKSSNDFDIPTLLSGATKFFNDKGLDMSNIGSFIGNAANAFTTNKK